MTERGSFIATFEGLFALVYGVRGDAIWQFQLEFGTGPAGSHRSPGLDRPDERRRSPTLVEQLELIERHAAAGPHHGGRRQATASRDALRPASGRGSAPTVGMRSRRSDAALPRRDLDSVITVTADLPANMSIGGADRQPLLDIDPDARATREVTGDPPTLPRPFEKDVATFRLGAEYVDPGGQMLVDGDLCENCSFTPATTPRRAPTRST